MGLFGFGDKKKKNAGLKKDILREIGSINGSTMEINKLVNKLEETVSDHVIIGSKEETAALEKILGQVSYIRSCVNAGKDSSARTAINETIKTIGKEWKSSEHESDYQPEKSFQGNLDEAADEFEAKLKRYNELLAIYNAAPDHKKQFYVGELTQLKMQLQNLQQKAAFHTKNIQNQTTNEALKEQVQMHQEAAKMQEEAGLSTAQLQKQMAELQSAREEQAVYDQTSAEVNQMLFDSDSLSSLQFEPFDQSLSFGAPSTQSVGKTSGSSQIKESATIQDARKKAEQNLERLESANEELKDQLADKNREYKRYADKARELLAKRKNMSQAEYKTIDHQIDELKIKLISLSREIDSYQNVLQQNNLKVALLNQLKTENDLDMLNKFGVNLDAASMEEISAYLYGKGKEKEEDLASLDAAAGGVLNSGINSLTSMTEGFSGDSSELTGDKDKYDEFEKVLARQ